MHINLESEASAVIERLNQRGYSESVLASHRRCYDGLKSYFAAIELTFTMDESVKWLETRKSSWSYGTYCQYRSALFRLERYLLNGNIDRTMCWSADNFACSDKALSLPEQLYKRLCDFKSEVLVNFSEKGGKDYYNGSKDFLLFIADRGCEDTKKLTLDPIMVYAERLYGSENRLYGRKRGWLAGIVSLLNYLARLGDIPLCYASALPRNTAGLKLSPLKLEKTGTAFQPSKELERLVPEYLSSLDEMRYNSSSKQLYCHDFVSFFLFLELNHVEYSDESVKLWLDNQSAHGTLWERKRHTITLFGDYLINGTARNDSVYTWQPLQIDGLPEWSKTIVTAFIAERKREGLSDKTLVMCRSAGYRLFKFLDSKGVSEPSEITPEFLKEFHNSDEHATPESKNAYGIKVRQLLSYMAEQGLVPKNLFLAISAQCAPRRNIVSVMSADMVSAVYDYRAKAAEPLELRNAAIVMLGLRMGLRGSDIAKLKIDDFDWQKRTVTFVQQKTRKEITLPVPTDVGNSVYKYIANGRPISGVDGTGYVFIRHLAPFGSVTRQVCIDALKDILSEAELTLKKGDGFHITRKTFATQMLISNSSPEAISNALGHALPETTEVYLARDEERMRLCPLPFESVGVS
jgi:site-specific recombinase XerD